MSDEPQSTNPREARLFRWLGAQAHEDFSAFVEGWREFGHTNQAMAEAVFPLLFAARHGDVVAHYGKARDAA